MISDAAQLLAAEKLQLLFNQLASYKPDRSTGGLFGVFRRSKATSRPKGLYMFGGVGRGKTMLMDLFYDCPLDLPKRRIHFHEFMSDTHDRVHATRGRMAVEGKGGDPIVPVADELIGEAVLLCLDEFIVQDITDAMILGRLFGALFERGLVLVATSNTAPANLYKGGLNRQLFLPFIDLLCERVDVLHLEADRDYRLEKLAGTPLYFTPADEAADEAMNEAWTRLTGHREPGAPAALPFKGREIPVPQAALGVARFCFADLCDQPLGAADFVRVAHTYHTILIDGIPKMGPHRRNQARRFINLIDALYDSGTCLIASADGEPETLYPEGDGAVDFARTASRLIEMRSQSYLERHGGAQPNRQ